MWKYKILIVNENHYHYDIGVIHLFITFVLFKKPLPRILKNMKNKYYQLKLDKSKNHTCVCLSNDHQIIRKWFGAFAELIFNEALIKFHNTNLLTQTVFLKTNQIRLFFVDITCLYQRLTYHYKIDKDLENSSFPTSTYNAAKSLLLQIRMNQQHPSYQELLTYYLDEFDDFNITLFDQTLNLLIDKKLIQTLITDDGNQFYDNNPNPHDHIYFKSQQKLMDCTVEISLFLKSLHDNCRSDSINGSIFYINSDLMLKKH